MPLRDLQCQNGHIQERYLATPDDLPVCLSCGAACQVLPRSDEGMRRARARAVFPFTTTHIDANGRPMVIESMGHLRQVERDYGVVLSAFSNNHNNSVDPLKGELPQYRGWDRRDHPEHFR